VTRCGVWKGTQRVGKANCVCVRVCVCEVFLQRSRVYSGYQLFRVGTIRQCLASGDEASIRMKMTQSYMWGPIQQPGSIMNFITILC
jgi:hypothetical protein